MGSEEIGSGRCSQGVLSKVLKSGEVYKNVLCREDLPQGC